MVRRICVVTGTRAEYGLLYSVIGDLDNAPDIELQLVVCGTHLAAEFGYTVKEIEKDGFRIAHRIEMLVGGGSPASTAKSIALGVLGFSDAFEILRPDFVLVLGDRYEILAAAQVALLFNIPIAHIAGGDTTEGAIDEAIRHTITKMAHIHFATNEESAQRIRQLGEDPANVHVVGSPGLDMLRRTPLLNRRALEASLGARLGKRNLLVTFHPVTLEPRDSLRQINELLAALDAQDQETVFWFTGVNADPGYQEIDEACKAWTRKNNQRSHTFSSLGSLRYLSLMSHCDAVVGNSSSGLYEAPSLKVPTVDVGNRQRGRLSAHSVIHCEATRQSIVDAIAMALTLDCTDVSNPYGDGHSAGRIVAILKNTSDPKGLLKKRFHLNPRDGTI